MGYRVSFLLLGALAAGSLVVWLAFAPSLKRVC
jgi:hypothetical protein